MLGPAFVEAACVLVKDAKQNPAMSCFGYSDRVRGLMLLFVAGCAAAGGTGPATPVRPPPPVKAAPPAPPVKAAPSAPRPRMTLTARVFRSAAELGPLGSQLGRTIDWEHEVLVLPGGWLPRRAARVVVSGVRQGPQTTAAPWAPRHLPLSEHVRAELKGDALHLHFVHDVNETGYCCSGIVDLRQHDAACRDGVPPPLPELPDANEEVTVTFLLAPSAVARSVTVERSTTLCVRP